MPDPTATPPDGQQATRRPAPIDPLERSFSRRVCCDRGVTSGIDLADGECHHAAESVVLCRCRQTSVTRPFHRCPEESGEQRRGLFGISKAVVVDECERRVTAARVTLSDVAARAGVSRTTASFVTTGRTDMRISADAQERVLRAARELDYRPSLLARSLRTNRSQTIGLLSDGVATEAFAGELIRGSMTSALLHEHLLFIAETAGDPGREATDPQHARPRGRRVRLRVHVHQNGCGSPPVLRTHPLVLVNCTTRARTVPTVIPDEREAGRAAARVLLRHGHTDRIVLVGETPTHMLAAAERLAGIQQVLAAQGLAAGRNHPHDVVARTRLRRGPRLPVAGRPTVGPDLPE